jgi:DinB superfamily
VQSYSEVQMEFTLEHATEVLSRTPATLTALLEGLSASWIRADEGPDTFSPFDVVGHLVDADETNWMTRARVILERGSDPRFPPFDRFRHRTRNAERTLGALLEEFAQRRAANLEELHSWALTPDDLEARGVHPEFGGVTLKQLLSTWVVHDLAHTAQIVRVMAKQYKSEVGPWVAFLPILSDRETKPA